VYLIIISNTLFFTFNQKIILLCDKYIEKGEKTKTSKRVQREKVNEVIVNYSKALYKAEYLEIQTQQNSHSVLLNISYWI
jgi:hypothetical protein